MGQQPSLVAPESVLAALYGKTSLETGMSEKRRDEVLAAAIFTAFRNQEFATRFMLPASFRECNETEDARGIDMIVQDPSGRKKQLQIKGIHIQRSISRRKFHQTRGYPMVMGRRTQKIIKRDSEELAHIMKGELKKIVQDYGGITLIITVNADLATQTSLEIAIRKNQAIVAALKAKEVWFVRNVPVRALKGKKTQINSYAYQLIKAAPDKHSYVFSFAL